MIRYYVDNPLPFYETFRVYDMLDKNIILGFYFIHNGYLNAKEKAERFCDLLNISEGEI